MTDVKSHHNTQGHLQVSITFKLFLFVRIIRMITLNNVKFNNICNSHPQSIFAYGKDSLLSQVNLIVVISF